MSLRSCSKSGNDHEPQVPAQGARGRPGCGQRRDQGPRARAAALRRGPRRARGGARRGGRRFPPAEPGHSCGAGRRRGRWGACHRGHRRAGRGYPPGLVAPVPTAKILPALEIQHRELGLLAPGDAVMDAQILRKSKDGVSNEILSASVPRARLDERLRLLQQAAVNVRMLDVEPLALLNAAIHLTGLDAGELLVLLTVGRHSSVLCLFSEQGPVVARYLDVGAETFFERLRLVFEPAAFSTKDFARALPAAEVPRAEAACREIVDRMVEDVRLSLTFYRTEYDRDSLPRYAIGGWIDLPHIIRWVTDRLGLGAPLEVMDPFKAVEVKAPQTSVDLTASGPQFLQAFGLALRGL